MQSLSISGNSLLIFMPLVAAALFLTWLSYLGRMPQHFGQLLKIILISLRASGILLIGLLLAEPIISETNEKVVGDKLAIVYDLSTSMAYNDSGGPRWRQADSLLRAYKFGFGKELLYGFSDSVRRLTTLPESTDFSGQATNLAAAISPENLPDKEKIGAILVVTDGSSNIGRDPLQEAEKVDIPVNSLVVGSFIRNSDTRISKIDAPPIAYENTEFELEIIFSNVGHEGEDALIELSDGNKLLKSSKVKLPADGSNASTKFKLSFAEEGSKKITASITRFEDDSWPENNKRSFFIKVLKSKIAILFVVAKIDWELAFLKRAFEGDGHFKIDIALTGNQKSLLTRSLPVGDQWQEYDLVIAIDINASALGGQLIELKRGIKAGSGFLYICGTGTDRAVLQSWEDLLPVRVTGKTGTNSGEFFPEVVEAALAKSLADIGDYRWTQVSPITKIIGPIELKTEAQAILEARTSSNETYPVCIAGELQSGKGAVTLGYPWWPRQFQTEKGRAVFGKFWANMARWLVTRDDMDKFIVSLSQSVLRLGQAAEFEAVILDDNYNPVSGGKVDIEISDSTGQANLFALSEYQPGRYQGNFGVSSPGEYSYRAKAINRLDTLRHRGGKFIVESASLEMENPSANVGLMKKIAEITGGKSYGPKDFGQFPNELKLKSKTVTEKKIYRPQESLVILLIAIALFSAEWAIRKFNQLA